MTTCNGLRTQRDARADAERREHVALAIASRNDPLDDLDPYSRLNWYMFAHPRGDIPKMSYLSFGRFIVVDLGLVIENAHTLVRMYNMTVWRDPIEFAAFNNVLDAVVDEDARARCTTSSPLG